MKFHYGFDEEGLFTSAKPARRDPGNPGPDDNPNYLLPGGATFTPPPELTGNQRARILQNGTWEVVEDNRGIPMYSKTDGHLNSMVALGPIPDDYTLIVPPDTFSKWDGFKWVADEVRLAAKARLDRDALIASVEWVIRRHEDEKAMISKHDKTDTTLTDDQIYLVRVYIQALRDYMSGWYIGKAWPAKPEFLP